MTEAEAWARVARVLELRRLYGCRDANEQDEPPLLDLRSVLMGLGCALVAGELPHAFWHLVFPHQVHTLLLAAYNIGGERGRKDGEEGRLVDAEPD